jgi:chromosome segregation ATPase
MSDVAALGDRITVALDRIRQGVAAQARADHAQDSLFDALQAERAQNAALKAQLAQVQAAANPVDQTELTQRVASQAAQLQTLDEQLQDLRTSLAQLQNVAAQLRHAATDGLTPEAHLAALTAEIKALETLRAADRAELDAILAELSPLIAKVAHAPS